MSDAKLLQAILDYRRGAIRVYDGPVGSSPRMGKMPPDYRNDLLEQIRQALDDRGGRFVHEKVAYSVEGDRIKESVWFG